jgi:hypothetical protein
MTRGDAQIARTIDEVLEALDGIVGRAIEAESRLGYFAALYRKVTAQVKEGIARGFFDDGPRMERLDVVFANRYLGALGRWEQGGGTTRAWQVAFRAAGRWRPTILQQLLLGINAHINLDLGIAAAETSPGAELPALQRDFDRINEILFSLVDQVQQEIGQVSPWIALLDRIGGRTADEIVRFSLGIARDEAWDFARDVAPLPQAKWGSLVELRDHETAWIGRRVLHPGWLLSAGLGVIRCRESNDVARVIRVLSKVSEPSLEEVEARRLERQARPPAAGTSQRRRAG